MKTFWAQAVGILLSGSLCTFTARAAAGDVDTSFNAETGVSGSVYVVKPVPDGKILIGGDFETVQGHARAGIARLDADGALDQTFNPPHLEKIVVFALAVQPDGKLLVGGGNVMANEGWILRLNLDGSIDSSFAPPSVWGQQVSKIIVEPDSKILVGGLFSINGGGPGDSVARLNNDGSVDTSFKVTAFEKYYDKVTGLILQQDGKHLVSIGHAPIRLNQDGSIDSSFSAPQFFFAWVSSMAAQPDGKVVLGGQFRFSELDKVFSVVRLQSDGSTDPNFFRLQRNDAQVPAIELDTDGSILVSVSSRTNELLRLRTNGLMNTAFAAPVGATMAIESISIGAPGTVYMGGAFAWPGGIANVARLHADGSIDATFQPGFSIAGVDAYGIGVDGENRLVAGIVANTTAIQRFNIDGSVDTNFAMMNLRGMPTAITVQKDGKTIVAGYSADPSIPIDFKRLNANGTIDQSFKTPWVTKGINAILQEPDGKIMIAGGFTTVNGLAADRVARLNADGSIDHTFQSLAFFGIPAVDEDIARSVAVQPDRKVLVGFELHACGCTGTQRRTVIRLNADGSYDWTFESSEIISEYANALAVQPDGKVLFGGFQFNQAGLHGLVRLNSDGALDTTFAAALSLGADVRAISFDASGKILLDSYGVTRLNTDGSTDTTFNRGDFYTSGMALAGDGNIYTIKMATGVQRPALVRLFGTPVPIPLKVNARTGDLTFDWSNTAMHLQSAPSVDGPFTDVQNARSPWKPSADQGNLFFRLRAD